jgi:hypothetical protein
VANAEFAQSYIAQARNSGLPRPSESSRLMNAPFGRSPGRDYDTPRTPGQLGFAGTDLPGGRLIATHRSPG